MRLFRSVIRADRMIQSNVMKSAKPSATFFLSSCIFAVDGILQIIFIFTDPVPPPVIQELVPTANHMATIILFLGWLVGLVTFVVGLARMLRTSGERRI